MNNQSIVISRANAEDESTLRKLWAAVFGDPPEIIDAFFQHFPPVRTAWVARNDCGICSAAYTIYGNQFVEPGRTTDAVYVYAVATFPEYRGNGYAGMLMRAIYDDAAPKGALLYTRPADSGLFDWYRRNMSAEHVGYATEETIALADSLDLPDVQRITPRAYGSARNRHLRLAPHILLSETFLALQELFSCGYYAIGKAVACCGVLNDKLTVLELLCDEEARSTAAQALLRHFAVDQAVLRMPCGGKSTPIVAYCGKMLPSQVNWGLLLE